MLLPVCVDRDSVGVIQFTVHSLNQYLRTIFLMQHHHHLGLEASLPGSGAVKFQSGVQGSDHFAHCQLSCISVTKAPHGLDLIVSMIAIREPIREHLIKTSEKLR